MQQGGAGAGQAGHEQRAPDRLGGDLGMTLAIGFQAEPAREQPGSVLPGRDPSEEAQLRLVLVRVQEPAEGLPEGRVAEVLEPGPSPGIVEQRLFVEMHELEARPPEDAPATVQCPCEIPEIHHLLVPSTLALPTATAVAVPSSCHTIRPGTPRSSSRTRLVNDSARAVSGASPSALPRTRYPPSCTPSAPGTTNAAARTACPRLSSITAVRSPTG